MFHNIIIKNGKTAHEEVNDIFEFVVQLDNDRKLKIDRDNDIKNKDFLDFTIDLKDPRGHIFVGSC